jgi:hypothetical protein
VKRTIVVCSYNRPIQEPTRRAILKLIEMGAGYMPQSGLADVALARNVALTGACAGLRTTNTARKKHLEELGLTASEIRERYEAEKRDMVLMVDDDMLFEPEQAQELIDHARATGVAASAIYATLASAIAGMRSPDSPEGERQRWYTGLGLLAVPAEALFQLERDSERFELRIGTQTAFTQSAMNAGYWMSEDFTLCKRLGGVHLLPVSVGHLKTIPIYADEVTVARIRDSQALPADLKGPLPPITHTQAPLTP